MLAASSKERSVCWCPYIEFQIPVKQVRRREALIAFLVVQDQGVLYIHHFIQQIVWWYAPRSEKHFRSTKLSEQLFEIIDDAVYRWALGRYHVTGPDDSHNARRRVLLRFLAGTRFDVVSPVELFADGCKTLFARHDDVVGSFAQHVRRSPSS